MYTIESCWLHRILNIFIFHTVFSSYIYHRFDLSYGETFPEKGEYKMYHDQLWTAPELLLMGDDMPPEGSQKGDVYSYAIIMQEVLFREPPFFLNEEDPKGKHRYIRKLAKGSTCNWLPDTCISVGFIT